MKTKKNSIPCLPAIAIALFISGCVSPSAPEETSITITKAAEKSGAEPEAAAVVTLTDQAVTRRPLKLVIKKLASSTAPVVIGLYRSKYKFLSKESRLKEYTFVPEGNTLIAQITDISYGEMAVAIYQDMNSNGKFDKTFLGLPKEGYAFSNNFRPLTKAPEYDDCKFNYDSTTHTVTMNLIK